MHYVLLPYFFVDLDGADLGTQVRHVTHDGG
jgi:hypothetical protein